jgi:RNA polymerase sigma-70 factor, ECF subfamily
MLPGGVSCKKKRHIEASLEERELILLARQGDNLAWERLIGAQQEAVFRLAYLLTGEADEAEDVAQETFIRAYRSLGSFDTTRPLRPWLLRIASNQSRNHRRGLGRRWAAMLRLAQQQGPPNGAAHRSEPDNHWQADALRRAVQRLRPNDQELIYLRYFLDLSQEEMAQTMGIAVGTVKSRLHRSLRRLRRVIERDHPEMRKTD